MKCLRCNDERIMFTMIPDVGGGFICWGSHIMAETNMGVGLFHYSCAGVDYNEYYELFRQYQLELAMEELGLST